MIHLQADFERFFSISGRSLIPTNELEEIIKKTADSLRGAGVFVAEQKGVKVSILPLSKSNPGMPLKGRDGEIHFWSYKILIENTTPDPIKVVSRTWLVVDSESNVDGICGNALVGMTPSLTKELPVFSYSSTISLSTPEGLCGGYFSFVDRENNVFE